MDLSLMSIIAAFRPAVHIAALFPFFTAIIIWAVFYFKYDLGRLQKIRDTFKNLADQGQGIGDCSRENLSFMDEAFHSGAPEYFLAALRRMRIRIEKHYTGDFIPEGRCFFDFDDMVTVPGCRGRVDVLWRSFWILGLMTLLLPPGIALLSDQVRTGEAFIPGLLVFALLCLAYLFFTLLDQKLYADTKVQYHRFIDTFDRVLPVTGAESALLMEAVRKNQDAYLSATDKIMGKFDGIVEDMLIPLMEDSLETLLRSNLIPAIQNMEKTLDDNLNRTFQLQQDGMERMTEAFADRLWTVVEVKMQEMAESIGSVQISMEALNQDMERHIGVLSLTTDRAVELQEEGMARIGAAFSESLANTLEAQTANMAMVVSDISGRMEEFSFNLSNHMAALTETTEKSAALQREQTESYLALQREQTEGWLSRQREQTDRSLAAQEERVTGLIDMQDARISQMMETQDQRILRMMETQENSLSALSDRLTGALTTAMESSILSLNRELAATQTHMEILNEKLAGNVEGISDMLARQQHLMEESAKMLEDSGELQQLVIEETREIQQRAEENSRVLGGHVNQMAETLEKLTEQTMTFTGDAFRFTKETSEAQMRMSESVKVSQDKLEAAVNETMGQYTKMNSMISDMMDNITGRMNEAMVGAGREIALGIKDVTADNAEAIASLTEQAQKLRDDYETYFSRMEDSTLKTIEDMDYQIRTITMRITEDIGAMMQENIKANADILERYKDNTTDLLQSFDEQARSIGLYAREINLDITDLSNNLRSSVEEFSSKMQEGVGLTLSEFDSGLSELTLRIANTVESISDAVEALPAALDKR